MKTRKYAFYSAFGLLLATGLLWLVAHYLLRTSGEFGDVIHPLEPLSLKLHGAAMMYALFTAGAMMPGHAHLHWRNQRNRLPGVLMLTALGLLVLTGWLLYYVATEETHGLIGTIHWVIGLVLLGILVWHRTAGLASRTVRRSPDSI
ncbi:MAG TPA: hypothetical protein VFS17_10845 [Methylophilaceae bacterium]|nr:hypothetical protein [Methylophilaceae bacterium]